MYKVYVIARNTAREIVRRPAFIVVMVLGLVALLFGRYLTLFALGEEVRMFKDIGVTTILFIGLLLVVISTTFTIHEEIESKTILTVLSRPISRTQVLLGKYLGLVIAITVAFVILLAVFLVALWWLLHYEYNFSDKAQPFLNPVVIKGTYLAFLQVLLLSGVSTVLSIFLGLLPNMAIVGILFVAGHLTDFVFSVFRDPVSHVMHPLAKAFYLLIPNLENYNVSSALIAGIPIPSLYLAITTLYTLVYLVLLFLLGSYLLQRRELL